MEIGDLRNDYDRVSDAQVNRYSNKVTLKSVVRFKENAKVTGKIKYMTANADHYQMPKTQRFSYNNDLTAQLPIGTSRAGWWQWAMVLVLTLALTYVIQLKDYFLIDELNKMLGLNSINNDNDNNNQH